MTDAKTIVQQLRGKWFGRYGITCCPAHANTRTPSLSIANGEGGRLLLHCHAGCSFLSILDALKGLGLVEGSGHYSPPSTEEMARVRQAEKEQAEKQEARALVCWREAVPIYGTIAETYLRHRGITAELPDTLRFHPDCWHPAGKRWPAMVALVEGAPRLAIHRTYLRPDGLGKAEVEPAKAMLGAVAGGAVRLTAGGDKLVVCEGIETGLSLASGLLRLRPTVWAALSTSGMKALRLPDPPGHVVIATDGDQPGKDAGQALGRIAGAWGFTVGLLPAPDGMDWNDVLRVGRRAA